MKTVLRNCPVCDSDAYSVRFKDHNRREWWKELESMLVQCKQCGMLYLRDIPDFNEFSWKYSEIYSSEKFSVKPGERTFSFFEKISWILTGHFFRKMMHHRNFTGMKVLDIGCNYGFQLKEFYVRWAECYGIDMNPKAVEDARKNLPKGTFHCSTIEACPFEKESFDIVRCSHVLEHVYDVKGFLEASRRLLKPGGELMLQMPNGGCLEFKIFGKFSVQSWVPFHINLFSTRTISRILAECGFREVRTKTLPIPHYWTWSLKQRFEKFPQTLSRLLFPIFVPVSLLLYAVWYGEELYAIAKK